MVLVLCWRGQFRHVPVLDFVPEPLWTPILSSELRCWFWIDTWRDWKSGRAAPARRQTRFTQSRDRENQTREPEPLDTVENRSENGAYYYHGAGRANFRNNAMPAND